MLQNLREKHDFCQNREPVQQRSPEAWSCLHDMPQPVLHYLLEFSPPYLQWQLYPISVSANQPLLVNDPLVLMTGLGIRLSIAVFLYMMAYTYDDELHYEDLLALHLIGEISFYTNCFLLKCTWQPGRFGVSQRQIIYAKPGILLLPSLAPLSLDL